MKMGIATFQIAFDGEAVRDGSIDVKTLAPSLLALGDLFDEANRVLNGDRSKAQLRVKGSFRAGSFEGSLDLVVSFFDLARSYLLHPTVQDAKQVLETIFYFGGPPAAGLWWIIKRIRGRRVKRARTIETDKVILELDDGEEIETTSEVARLYNDNRVLEASRDVLQPLQIEGVDTFTVSSASIEPQTVTKADLAAFEAPLQEQVDEEKLGESTARRYLRVVRPSFREDFIWTFSDGDNTLRARIEDTEFLGEVDSGLGFTRDSVIEADMESVATRTPTGRLSTRNTITRVHRVVPPPKQARFEFESESE